MRRLNMKHYILDATGNLQINMKARSWCKLPYPNHPKGCPNFGRRETCPPLVPPIDEVFKLDMPVWLVAVEFDLATHMDKMRKKHPNWSDRQLRCLLYWQGTVVKELKIVSGKTCQGYPGTVYTTCPEAMGVNVISTGRKLGLPIQLKPKDTVYKMALVGYPTRSSILAASKY